MRVMISIVMALVVLCSSAAFAETPRVRAVTINSVSANDSTQAGGTTPVERQGINPQPEPPAARGLVQGIIIDEKGARKGISTPMERQGLNPQPEPPAKRSLLQEVSINPQPEPPAPAATVVIPEFGGAKLSLEAPAGQKIMSGNMGKEDRNLSKLMEMKEVKSSGSAAPQFVPLPDAGKLSQDAAKNIAENIKDFIAISSPEAGAVWYAGEKQMLDWNSFLPKGSRVKITATSAAQPGSHLIIASNAFAENSQGDWTIPYSMGADQGPGSEYTLKIETLDGKSSDQQKFYIYKPSLDLTFPPPSPNQYQCVHLARNGSYQIKWTKKGDVGEYVKVKITYPYNGQTKTNVFMAKNTGSVAWPMLMGSANGYNFMQLEVPDHPEIKSEKHFFFVSPGSPF